jgi:hypothetical protein
MKYRPFATTASATAKARPGMTELVPGRKSVVYPRRAAVSSLW